MSFIEVQMSLSLKRPFNCLLSDDITSAVLSKQRAAISDGDTLVATTLDQSDTTAGARRCQFGVKAVHLG